jgi:pyruvate formate lyase activating enzyme
MEHEGHRGDVLEQLFAGVDLIGNSEAGRTFTAFWRLLTDGEQSLALTESLDAVTHRDFARRLESLGRKMWIRFVLVPGLTDAPSNVEGLADFAASLKMVERVEVAPFHKLGEFKWRELRMRYELAGTEPPTTESLLEVRRQFSSRGLTVV